MAPENGGQGRHAIRNRNHAPTLKTSLYKLHNRLNVWVKDQLSWGKEGLISTA